MTKHFVLAVTKETWTRWLCRRRPNPRLNVLDLQRLIRVIPKPVIAMVRGYAIGGGNVLNVVCDLTIAADNAIFGQTGPKVGSFDAGYGSGYLARIVGHKKHVKFGTYVVNIMHKKL